MQRRACHAAGSAALVLAALTTSACLIIPPSPHEPFARESTSFLVVGETHRDEVYAQFAENPLKLQPQSFGNGAAWIYHSTSPGWGMFACGLGGGCTLGRDTRDFYLVIRFDAEGRLTGFDVVSLTWGCSDGLCRHADGTLMVLADAVADQAARKSPVTTGCAVYLYTSIPYEVYMPLTFLLNAQELGALTHERGFFLLPIDPGTYTLTAQLSDRNWRGRVVESSTDLQCVGGQSLYVHHLVNTTFWTVQHSLEVQMEPATVARQQLAQRRLAWFPERQESPYE